MAYKQLKLWFDKDLAILLADKICTVEKKFNKKPFVKYIDSKVNQLELKDRVEIIADALYETLEEDFEKGITTLVQILGPENEKKTGMFTEYYWIMPIAKYVEKYGLGYFPTSMNAIYEITKRNTSEYAIRPFIRKDEKKTIRQMKKWADSKNNHVRRLSSEGLRPRLPWATKLDSFISDPRPIIPILSKLKDDKSKYVQKSVANCINDMLKDNYNISKELIEEWNSEKIGPERKWIIKHALRNCLKAGDTWALDIVKSFYKNE